MKPTQEQEAIFRCAADTDNHLIVDAKAGSGKTTTLVQLLPMLRGSISLQAFNRAIADELKLRVGNLGIMVISRTSVSTVHSHGLNSFRMASRKPQVQGGKLNFMMKDQMQDYGGNDPVRKNARHIARLVGMAKASGFGLGAAIDTPESYYSIKDTDGWQTLIDHFNMELEFEGQISCEQVIEEAIELLEASNRRQNMIDFDDMIYLPLLLGLPIKTYDNVLIDEAQDINATRRELAFQSLAKQAGRMIAVGDPHQAIYGFTGAAHDSMARISQRLGSPKVLPLSICWRCDKEIISEAQKIVPGIQARPNAPSGQVSTLPFRQEPTATHAGWDFLSYPRAGDAILCRLNKPNVAVALGLLRRGTPARIEGRDLGKKLLDHVRKATENYNLQPLSETVADLEDYKAKESYKLVQREREAAAALLEDEVDAAVLLIERCIETNASTVGKSQAKYPDLEALVEQLFGDDVLPKSCVTLSSVHKAKGREWPRVFILGRSDYMPFFKAELQWEIDQEMNLIYVAVTRAERELVYVTGVASALDKGLHREGPIKQRAASPTADLELQTDISAAEREYD